MQIEKINEEVIEQLTDIRSSCFNRYFNSYDVFNYESPSASAFSRLLRSIETLSLLKTKSTIELFKKCDVDSQPYDNFLVDELYDEDVDGDYDDFRDEKESECKDYVDDVESLLDAVIDDFEDKKEKLFDAAEYGDLKEIKDLAENGVDVTSWDNDVFKEAITNGYLDIVKYLVEEQGVDITADKNWAFSKASDEDHTEIVKYLVVEKGVDVTSWDNNAIRRANGSGNSELVEFLINEYLKIDKNNFNILKSIIDEEYLPMLKKAILENNTPKPTQRQYEDDSMSL